MSRARCAASVLALLLCLVPGRAAGADEAKVVPLQSLDLSLMKQGWGEPQVDRSVREKPLSIGGKTFARGVGTHARSAFWVRLPEGAQRFRAWVGVDDAAGNKEASVRFRVYAGESRAFDSGVMRLGDAAKRVDLDVGGAKSLILLVEDGGDGIQFDHANWAEAEFVLAAGASAVPVAVRPAEERAEILTPRPPATPRVNGPRVFGVRPGHPFLFTIPATGQRPMRFAVDRLPEGLKVDEATGQITGTLAAAGEHVVTFRATNALGTASREFRIVCGDTLALTPHMGWNSWYIWKDKVTDRIMREAADAMVSTGLIDHGYSYVNIDDCWSVAPDSRDPEVAGLPRDAEGRILTNKRFPDMKALTDYIHAKGLKAGTYTSPGPLTCGKYAGSYQHEEQDARQFAEWGFDFLKYDWCSYGQIAGKGPDLAAMQKPYRLMGEILKRQDRDIVYNLCQYGMGDVWKWGKDVGGHSWRTAGDLGGSFEDIGNRLFRDAFDRYAERRLQDFGGPGGWNDPDYLLIGFLANRKGEVVPTPLTPNEQYTHVSLWALLAAPLILSGDITRLDEFTLSLLTNDEVIDIDQDPLGKPGHRASRDEEAEVWVRDLHDGTKAVGLFNRGEFPRTVTARWADVGLAGDQVVRDVWRQKDLGTYSGQFKAKVPRHGVVLLRLRPQVKE